MRTLFGFGAMAAMSVFTGCQPQNASPKQALTSKSVLDVRPISKSTATPSTLSQRVTPPDEPTVAPVYISTATPASSASPAAHIAGAKHVAAATSVKDAGSYQVKKGDTLFRIAQTQYGNGKKWTMIASANPGLSPQSLKVGQTIRLP